MMKVRTHITDTAKDVERISPTQKCIVLGSTGYNGIDAVEWDAKELPNSRAENNRRFFMVNGLSLS